MSELKCSIRRGLRGDNASQLCADGGIEHGLIHSFLYPPVFASSRRDLCENEGIQLSEMH